MCLVEKQYDIINIVFIHGLGVYGTIENMGAFASIIKYKKDDVELEDLFDNEDFSIMDEIVFEHIIEEEK